MKISANTKSFTLIEIVMVLVMTGMIIAVVAPQWNKYLTYWEIETEAREIMAMIRAAQEKAIRVHRPARIVFEQGTNIYRFEYYNASWHEEESGSMQGQDVYLAGTTLPYQDSETAAPNQTNPAGYVVTFDEFGTVTLDTFPSPQGQITLSSKDNSHSLVVYINKITGSVSINQ